MAQVVLPARPREGIGKGAAKKLRKEKQIPAVFYGPKTDPVLLAVDYPELDRILKHASSENFILDLQLKSDRGTETRKAILKDLQMDPCRGTFLHVDFYEISMDREITLPIPIQLINTPQGVTNGGILQQIMRELTISCLPNDIIEALIVDVAGLDIGDSLHVENIELPEGIKCIEEPHLTVAVVSAPAKMPEEVEEEEIEEALEEETAEEPEA